MAEIRPFKIDVPQSEVERLQRKLQDTRLPPREILPGVGWDLGALSKNTSHKHLQYA